MAGDNGQPGPWQELREVRGELASLSEIVNQKVLPTLAKIEAKVELSSDRHGQEIGVLFSRTNEHERRIASIERDYVTRTGCDTRHKENRDEHEQFRGRLGGLDVSTAKIAMIGGLVALIVSPVITWLCNRLMSGH